MTPDLLAQLRKTLAFDVENYTSSGGAEIERVFGSLNEMISLGLDRFAVSEIYLNGLKDAHSRRTKVDEALVFCVSALQQYCSMKATVRTVFGDEPIDWQLTPAGEALERLSQALER